jgi:hypothetical protein
MLEFAIWCRSAVDDAQSAMAKGDPVLLLDAGV